MFPALWVISPLFLGLLPWSLVKAVINIFKELSCVGEETPRWAFDYRFVSIFSSVISRDF